MLYEVITCNTVLHRNGNRCTVHQQRHGDDAFNIISRDRDDIGTCRLPFHQVKKELHQFGIPTGISRITSYNVCYTKLLRYRHSWHRYRVLPRNLPLSYRHVITSYSIHYTKLYDSCTYQNTRYIFFKRHNLVSPVKNSQKCKMAMLHSLYHSVTYRLHKGELLFLERYL